MGDRRTKSAIIQWLIPATITVIILLVMLHNFSVRSRQAASDAAMKAYLNMAERYAEKVNYEIKGMMAAGKTVMRLIEEETWISEKEILEMENAICENSDAYEIMFYGSNNSGLLHDGSRIEISKISYLSEIVEELKEMREGETYVGEPLVYFTYVFDDEIGVGDTAVIMALMGKRKENTLLLYYPAEKLDELFVRSEFGVNAFYALTNSEGEIIKINSADHVLDEGDIIWDAIESSEWMSKVTVRMRNKASGSFRAVMGGKDRSFIYAPVGINNWSLLMGIDQRYVDARIEKEISDSEQMIYRLIMMIGVFLGLVIVINIIGKIRNNEKKKKLEKKADTDLLTGLSNKLATERKIKEYMEKHPKEQALLFVLDVDNFKKVNDTLGHAFGDEVLSALGHQVSAMFRSTDVVGRIGGDEFMILLKNLNTDEALEKEARKLADFFKDFRPGEYIKYAATASMGAAVFPKDGADFESLYKAADSALYVAKKRGKSQLAFYGDESEKSEGKKRVEAESRVIK